MDAFSTDNPDMVGSFSIYVKSRECIILCVILKQHKIRETKYVFRYSDAILVLPGVELENIFTYGSLADMVTSYMSYILDAVVPQQKWETKTETWLFLLRMRMTLECLEFNNKFEKSL